MFEIESPSRWMPYRVTPQLLLDLTTALLQLGAVPIEDTTWGLVKAATAVFEVYRPDEVASQVLTLSLLGYTHSTFLMLAAECSEELLPACSPRALADLAVGFSSYRLDSKGLRDRLVAAAAVVLPRFSEYDLARLLTGLMYRRGLDLSPIIDAAEFTVSSEDTLYSNWHRDALSNLTLFKESLFPTVVQHGSWARPFTPKQDWPMFKPAVGCPPGRPLTRYPDVPDDGSKLLCQLNEEALPADKCLIYSLGSHGNFKFEKAMLKATECQIHTFDCTYDGKAIHPTRHHYHKWCIGPDSQASSPGADPATGDGTPEDPSKIRAYRSWANITETLGHQAVHLLKIDIEGYEYPLLAEFKHGDTLPSEIAVELHARGDRQIGLKPRTAGQLALLFSHLGNLGYAAY
eukprot:gene10692-10850_t